MRRLAVLAVLCTLASPAHAEKKRKTAQVLAGVGVGFSSALVVSSFLINVNEGTVYRPTFYAGLGTSIVTPSLGQWYVGRPLTIGMAIRGSGALLALYGISQTQDHRCVVDPSQNCPTISDKGITILGLAAIAYVAGVAYDVVDAPHAVDRYNRRHAMIVPTATDRSAGLAFVGRW